MTDRIKQLTERLFSDIPYSKATEEARWEISDALQREYDAVRATGQNELQSMGSIMSRYGAVEDVSVLAGLNTKQLCASEGATDEKALRRVFLKIRLWSILAAFFLADIVILIAQACFLRSGAYLVPCLIYLAVAVGAALICRRKGAGLSYDRVLLLPSARERLRLYSDRYRKRTVNSFLLMVGLCSVFAAITISGISKTTMSGDEMLSMVMSNIYIPAAGLFICIKNTLYLHFLNSTVSPKLRREVRKYTVRCALICGAYIAAVTAAVLAFLRKSSNAYLVLYFAGAVFILVFAVLNLDKRKRLVTRNIRINKPRIVAFGMAAVLTLSVTVMQRDVYALTPYIMGVSEVEHKTHPVSYDEDTGVYTITADSGDFRILHLTDIHLGGSLVSSYKDYKALHACYKLIEETKPDLVIVTGDMVFPMGIMSMSLNNQAPVIQFASFMRNVGIPWAFTYGNHDTESMATGTREEICALYRSLSYKSSGNLLYPYVQPDIYGRSNQMIRIENPDGSIRQALFLLDSNDYTGEGINKYDCIHDDQVDWYAEQVRLLRDEAGETVPSMLFFHIPLQEYRTAYELYEQGISEVKYFFGVVGETMINPICCSELPSRLFETAVGLGSTQAMFCGHDHYNNISLEYEGIRLSYGMSIDYLAMPGIDKSDAQRGAELITIHGDSGFDLCQIRLSDIT